MGSLIERETCGRCGRKLKTEASRQAGFGPVCKKKWEAEKAKDQMEWVEVPEPITKFKMDAACNLTRVEDQMNAEN